MAEAIWDADVERKLLEMAAELAGTILSSRVGLIKEQRAAQRASM